MGVRMAGFTQGPLAGVRIVELDAPGPVTFACMLLADLGCDVVRIPRIGGNDNVAQPLFRGRTDVRLDLSVVADRERALALITAADGVVEGFRTGVAEQLGLDPARCLAANPRLVYGRASGWGRDGPLAGTAGADINHLALSGALHAIGPAATPLPPLNLVGEYAGGALFLALGMVAAILSAQATGKGQIVEAAQIDGAAALMTLYYALHTNGHWSDARAANLIDGGAPFYRCYACADGRHVAVGAIEPQAFRALCAGLGIAADRFEPYDRACWDAMASAFSAAFKRRTRDEWNTVFASGDACVTPVLSLAEAPRHPHNRARGTFADFAGVVQPAPAPRFSATPAAAAQGCTETIEQTMRRWS